MTDPRVLIVGAGIAGLGAAQALRAHGIKADVVERHPQADAGGTGIYLPANAVRALTSLGFGDEIRSVGHEIRRQRLLDHRGKVLLDLPIEQVWGGIAPSVAVRHAELRRILRSGLESEIVVKTFVSDDAAPYDLVVGADGIRSAVRGWVFPDAAPRRVGELAWRFVADGYVVDHLWCTWQGNGRTFLAVSLGGGQVYCYADLTAAAPPPGDWRRVFDEFPETVRDLVARATDAHASTIEDVFLDTVARGKTVLIGDAAHAFSPNMAQGAALALEDGLVLAEHLDDLASYARRRVARARWVRDQTRRRDRARHLPPPLRDAVLRTVGPRLFKAAFRPLHDPP
ncbi:FAD-dependent monooxygenase [Asanoa iriomotensis]|uniref:2-heptyl-3-hydroxy-4(1H)-quinolone synthase n=1 Tax=Asanoa iriomotensis TaxID=234613 RepID=A0ABQ4C5X1_9ACTN|nr:FAD-dependent monooxygenase [Asanoa iriomotensis]GIF57670.1 2-heptyl-3-hydroxy-4(1H)-quinolone synthase [Asanoa iriomotensis]